MQAPTAEPSSASKSGSSRKLASRRRNLAKESEQPTRGARERAAHVERVSTPDRRVKWFGHREHCHLDHDRRPSATGELVGDAAERVPCAAAAPIWCRRRCWWGVAPVGSFSITADGHVRHYDLVPAIRNDPRPHTLREQLGIDKRPFDVDQEKTELDVAKLAELVQDLPLSCLRS